MIFSGEHTVAVHHPLGRHFRFCPGGSVHGPAHHTCAQLSTQVRCYSTIRSYPPFGDLPGYFIYICKKTVFFERVLWLLFFNLFWFRLNWSLCRYFLCHLAIKITIRHVLA